MSSIGRPPSGVHAAKRFAILAGCCAALVAAASPVAAQRIASNVGGVYVDPQGMLRETGSLDQSSLREMLRDAAQREGPSRDVSAKSPLRKISLRRLEAARLAAAGDPIPADLKFLAGLTQLKFVFLYPETSDVVLAGPAEGWEILEAGDVVGRQSRRPVLQLDDLIVGLRYAFDRQPDLAFLGCSIEPTEQGIKAHTAFVRRIAGFDRTQLPQVVEGMEQAMGPQDVLVYGVPGSTRFALEMIAADYRLKRLALAHDPSPVPKVPSYLDLAEKSITGGPQRQHRWWFVGHYDAIRHTEDRRAFEFEGAGLKVDTAPTQLKSGQRDAKPTRAATQFAELATRNLPALAERIPAFAELQNLVALAVAAEIIRQGGSTAEDIAEGDGDAAIESEESGAAAPQSHGPWQPEHFLDEEACPIASLQTPRQTPSLANARFVKDQFWLFSISGGVEIDPRRIAAEEHLKPARGRALGDARNAGLPSPGGRWWWD